MARIDDIDIQALMRKNGLTPVEDEAAPEEEEEIPEGFDLAAAMKRQGLGQRTGREAQGAFGEAPDYKPPRNELFPNASQMGGHGILGKAGKYGMGALDALGYPMRKAAELRGQDAADPGAYLLRPEAEAAAARAEEDAKDLGPMDYIAPGGFQGMPFPMPTPHLAPELIKLGGQMGSDPFSYLGPTIAAIKRTPQLLNALADAAGFTRKGVGYVAGKAGGTGREALEFAGTPEGRAAMAQNFGKEAEIGSEALERIQTAESTLPEFQQSEAALEKMGTMKVSPTTQRGEAVLAERAAGTGGRGFSPGEAGGVKQSQEWIDWMRGGPLPKDLAEAAEEAARAAQAAKAEAGTLGAQAAQAGKEAAQATRAQASTASKAGKAAQEAGATKKEFLTAADRAGKNVTRFGGARDEAGAAAEAALEEARATAATAREAATKARARVAIGEVTAKEAEAAEQAALAAERNSEVLDAAALIRSAPDAQAATRELAQELSGKGKSVPDIIEIITNATKKVQEIPELLPDEVTAVELNKLRRKLDPNIDWISDPDAAEVKDKVLKVMRSDIADRLRQRAIESGNEEWIAIMERFHKKLTQIENVKGMIGKTGKSREQKVEAVIRNLFGANKETQRKFLDEFEKTFGGDTMKRAKAAQMARAFGESGKPGLLPAWGTGAGLSAAGNFGMMLPRTAAMLATGLTASPLISSRVTLPALKKAEEGLRKLGVALSPRAKKVMGALEGPVNEGQKARLLSILVTEMEQAAEAAPRPSRAAERDRTSAPDKRVAAR